MENRNKLSDADAIRCLKARYFRLIDTKKWEELETIFTDEVFFDIEGIVTRDPATGLLSRQDLLDVFPGPSPAVVSGLAPVIAFISGALNDIISIHHGFTAEIVLDGDEGSAIWAMEDMFFEKQPPHAKIRQAYGHYRDAYRRVDGHWKIASMTLSFIHEEWL